MNPRAFKNNARASVLAIGLAVLLAQLGGDAQVNPPVISLPYSNSYLVTGNYVVGGVDLHPTSGGGGSQTGTINISGNFDNREVLAAYLYWETVVTDPSELTNVRFRGELIDLNDVEVVRTASQPLTPSFASCFSSGGGPQPTYTMMMVRADVRRLLPRQFDANGRSTGKRLVSVSDLANNIDPETNQPWPAHTVTLPESGTGNQVPQSAGASLLVIYRDPTEPLRKIVVYDNAAWGTATPSFILPNAPGAMMSQAIRGIYQSSSTKNFKLTHIVGSGQPNGNDRVFINGTRVDRVANRRVDPFPSGAASDRSWATSCGVQLADIPQPDAWSDKSARWLRRNGHNQCGSYAGAYDCLTWAAIVFSTDVKDVEGDGVPDGIEDARRRTHQRREWRPAPEPQRDGRQLPAQRHLH